MDQEGSDHDDDIQEPKEEMIPPTTMMSGEEEDEEGVDEQQSAVDANAEHNDEPSESAVEEAAAEPRWTMTKIERALVVMIAVGYCLVMRFLEPQQVETPQFHCPNAAMSVPVDDTPFYINASR